MTGVPMEGEEWQHQVDESFGGLLCLPTESGGPMIGRLDIAALGDVHVFRLQGSAQQVRRTAMGTRRQPLDLVKTCLVTRGCAVLTQDDHTLVARAGQFIVYDTNRPYDLTLPLHDWSCSVMTVPRTALGLTDGLLHRGMEHTFMASGAGRLLGSFLTEMPALASAGPGARTSLGAAGVALLAGALADGCPRVSDVPADVVLHQVVAWIRANLDQRDLSTDVVARAHLMSRRTLQRLFENEERGVEGLIRDLRLEAIRCDLVRPAMADRSIAHIASRWCIIDASWLARAFRARYGLSPSAYRRYGDDGPQPGALGEPVAWPDSPVREGA